MRFFWGTFFIAFLLWLSPAFVSAQETAVDTMQSAPAASNSFSNSNLTVAVPLDSAQMAKQLADSLLLEKRKKDSLEQVRLAQLPPSTRLDYRTAYWKTVQQHPLIAIGKKEAIYLPVSYRVQDGKEDYFYLLCGLLFLLGIIRLAFGKYFQDLFRLVFRNTSFRQKQLREQLLQTPLASLLLNVFFLLSGGIYISLLLQHYHKVSPDDFWEVTGITISGLALLYLLKFTVLKVIGWVFSLRQAMNTYGFIVFLINKLAGLFLVPFLLFIAFSAEDVLEGALVLSWIMLAILFLVRYLIAWRAIATEVKVSSFHFFLYLCAFEVAPLLLIYKALSDFI